MTRPGDAQYFDLAGGIVSLGDEAGGLQLLQAGGFDVSASYAYSDCVTNGVFTAQVSDTGGQTVGGSTWANVADAPLTMNSLTITATEGILINNGIVAHFTDGNRLATASQFSGALITWADGTTSLGTVEFASRGGFDVRGTHVYIGATVGAMTVTVSDHGGQSTSGSVSNVTVVDAPLSVTNVNLLAVEGQPVHGVVAHFIDLNPLENDPAAFEATIDWGDGSTSMGHGGAQPHRRFRRSLARMPRSLRPWWAPSR